MRSLTHGGLRYRLSVPSDDGTSGHVVVRDVVHDAFERNPRLLNDPQEPAWLVELHRPSRAIEAPGRARKPAPATTTGRWTVELRPRLTPNPRVRYQTATHYAGAHPPLAASMARLAGEVRPGEVVWDPFCGGATELIEVALRAGGAGHDGVRLVGTDLDATAIGIAEANVAAAARLGADGLHASFHACDFRDAMARVPELTRGRVSLIVSNPPLGRRVKVRNLHALFADLFDVASTALCVHGRAVLVNPLRARPKPSEASTLRLVSRRVVDLGLRHDCGVEVWEKVAPDT